MSYIGNFMTPQRMQAILNGGEDVIKITVELDSAISEDNDAVLGEAFIYNDATGTKTRGNYKALFSKRGGFKGDHPRTAKNVWKTIEIKNFPRQELLAWDLLYRALYEIVAERNWKGVNDVTTVGKL